MNERRNERNRTIIHTNLFGILLNLFLSAAKLIVGLVISSRAVVLDALNGFSDMLSSGISILSAVFAGRRADRRHPFGYGRLEYITSMFTTVFIVYMGLYAIYGTIRDLLSPDSAAPDYNAAVVVIMVLSMAAKIVYGVYARKTGKRINAVALIMSGTESVGDSLVSLAILGTILIYRTSGVDLEPWLSIVISLALVKTGVVMIVECGNKLLGVRGDPEDYKSVKKLIAEEEDVLNVFNLVIHQYGEGLEIGSVDIEVDETMTAAETTRLVRRIRRKAEERGVTLSAVGVYGTDSRDAKTAELWDKILSRVQARPEVLRAYAFSYDEAGRTASFVVVLNPSVRDGQRYISALSEELGGAFPGVAFEIEAALDL